MWDLMPLQDVWMRDIESAQPQGTIFHRKPETGFAVLDRSIPVETNRE